MADQGVHQGVLEGVAHVQGAGDIGRWQQDGIGRARAARGKCAALFPEVVPAGFEKARFEAFVHAYASPRGALGIVGKGRRL